MKEIVASLAIKAIRTAGSPVLNLARRVLPLSVKMSLLKSISSNLPITEDVIVAFDGHKFTPIKDAVFMPVRMEGAYEKRLSNITRSLIRPEDSVIDVGANFGWYSILFAKAVGPAGKFFSFEPNTDMFSVLAKNIELNNYGGRVFAKPVGIGEEAGTKRFKAAQGEFGLGHIVSGDGADESKDDEIRDIVVEPLDKLFADSIGKIAYVKIDVEGFEPFVISGGQKLFNAEDRPIVQVEFNSDALKRQPADKVKSFMAFLNQPETEKFAGQSGALVRLDEIKTGQDNDLFLFPKTGKYSGRRGLV